ncbi:MAG TPA: DUF4388 domain-containing protein [Geothrix sp.]|nr:DUF4388 domain-containing protein [Geothrix sp.]
MSLAALKDLLSRRRGRATGVWTLGDDPKRTIFLEEGDVVFATSTHPLDRLTHLLVERGRLTQAQLDYAMANLNPTMSVGKNLIQMGFITQRDLLEVARGQVERVVLASLAEPRETPQFEAKDLDATTVRLPLDTPAMLLAGVLNLQDREGLLEVLGPLNQVVVLEGRKHQDLTIPADLTKVPALMDGSRTLLELSRESGIEPFRLGAFALFLREMGWARLHEIPNLDRQALAEVLDPAEAPLSPPLPESPLTPASVLIAQIHASQQPTTNLEHLAEALDQLQPLEPLGEAIHIPSPEFEPPPVPEPQPEPPAAPEPALPIHHETEGRTEPLEPPPPEHLEAPPRSRALPLLLVLLVFSLSAWVITGFRRRHPAPQPTPAKTSVPAPVVTPEIPQPAPSVPVKQAPEPKVTEAPKTLLPTPAPEPPKPAKSTVFSKEDRLRTILQGEWKQALAQGLAHQKALPHGWVLRLEIACQGSTVQHAAGQLKDRDPDLFILPMTMRDGRTCYQVFLGHWGSEAAAKNAAKKLPAIFLAEGNRPKPFRVGQIPDHQ